MIVDSSVVIELLLRSSKAERAAQEIVRHGTPLSAPHLIDIEVLHALRRYSSNGKIDALTAKLALSLTLMTGR